MKHKAIVFISLISSFVFISIGGVYAHAQEYISHTSCVDEHFNSVQNDAEPEDAEVYPTNDIGNCPYVASSLLLSFYDAYWDDRFVPDNYETTGAISTTNGNISRYFYFALENDDWNKLKRSSWWGNYSESYEKLLAAQQAYSTFIRDNADDYFQLYLISLGIDQGLHNNDNTDDGLTYGLTPNEMVDFLRNYLYNIRGFREDQVTVHCFGENLFTITNEDVFNKAKEILSGGAPVIVNGLRIGSEDEKTQQTQLEDTGSHSFLAYDIIENENDIVVTYCYNEEEARTFRTMSFKYLSSIIWLEINPDAFPHSHSTSYVSSETGHGYCACEIYSEHPNHTHNYQFTSYDYLQHWRYCLCGAKTQIESHNIELVNNKFGNHKYACSSNCGFKYEGSHSYTYSQYSTSEEREIYHRKSCACGYEEAVPHNFVFFKLGQWVCEDCGYIRTGLGGGSAVIKGKKEDEDTE